MATLKAIPGGQGGAVVSSNIEPYGFTPDFERALIYLCCCNRDVYSRIGSQLDPKALVDATGVRLIKAAQAIAEDLGEGPSSLMTVVQRLKAWREDGKITHEQIREASEYLDAAEDAGLPDAVEVIKEVALLLRKRAKKQTLHKAMDVYAKGGDFKKLGEEIAAVERIGEARGTLGETIHEGILDEIVAENTSTRFPTGSFELDRAIGGGLPTGYTMFLGREKSGKSMVLSSIASHAYITGKTVAVATLELATKKQIERIIANMTNCTLESVQTGSAQVRKRLKQITPRLGKLSVAMFSPDTPVGEITRWAERLPTEWGRKLDLLVVDYVDLVGSGRAGKEEGDYKAQKTVGNALRDHALQNNYCIISAAQGKRGSGGTARSLDNDDAADSMHKIRIPDLVIAMRMEPDQKDMVDWFITASRDGNDRVGTGPLPTARSVARMFPVQRDEPWESEDQGYTRRPADNYEY